MNLKEAIQFVEACKDTHVQWKKFQENNNDWKNMVRADIVGDIAHHEKLVDKYNELIGLLKQCTLTHRTLDYLRS